MIAVDGVPCEYDDTHSQYHLPQMKLRRVYIKDDHLHQIFCERAKKEFAGLDNVEIIVRDEGTCSYILMSMTLSPHHYYSLGCREEHGQF